MACGADFEEEDQALKVLYEQIIQNPVVTDCFLNFLPIPDILTASLVSKAWYRISRDFLRRRRHCLMKCTFYDPPGLADRLKVLEIGILDQICHPFSGLYFLICEIMGNGELFCISPEEGIQIETSLSNIIARITKIKRVVIELMDDTRNRSKFVPAFQFLFRSLPIRDIESLRFCGKFVSDWDEILHCVPDGGFPKLKKFESDCDWLTRITESMYGSILKRCPALLELRMSVESTNVGIFKEFDKLCVIKNLRVLGNKELKFGSPQMKIFEGANIQLETFSMDGCENWEGEQFFCISRILQPCSRSLRKFISRDNNYEQIFKIKIPPMPNVMEVTVCYLERDGPRDNDQDMQNHPRLKELFPNAVIVSRYDRFRTTVYFPKR